MNARRRPVQARSHDTVQRILDAAAHVVSERGYHECSTNRIADAADISKGSLYQYFSGKDDVLAALVERIFGEITARISKEIDAKIGPDWQTLGSAVLSATLGAFDEYTAMLRPLMCDAPHLRIMEQLDTITERALDVGRTYIALNRDQFRSDLDVDATLAVLVRALRATVSDYVQGKVPIARERLQNVLQQVALHALVPDERLSHAKTEPAS